MTTYDMADLTVGGQPVADINSTQKLLQNRTSEDIMESSTADRENDAIDLNDGAQIKYWCEQFGITDETLRGLVERHGPVASDVRVVLGQ